MERVRARSALTLMVYATVVWCGGIFRVVEAEGVGLTLPKVDDKGAKVLLCVKGDHARAMRTNWPRIWEHITRDFQCDHDSVHGPSHWRRVERNGLLIGTRSGAVEEVVRLFAVFHDSRREHDGWDKTHGSRGAAYAAKLRSVLFDISDDHFELLHYACTWHTHGQLIDEPTIGTCWDADRLDLGRVGTEPEARYMSTDFGREIGAHGSIETFIQRAGAA